MLPEKALFLFLTLFTLFIFILLGKKISYWIAPDAVVGHSLKKTLMGMNVFFALILAAAIHALLETYISFEVFLEGYPFFRLIIIVFEVSVWIILIGFSIEKYLVSCNKDFREWKGRKK